MLLSAACAALVAGPGFLVLRSRFCGAPATVSALESCAGAVLALGLVLVGACLRLAMADAGVAFVAAGF